MAYIDFRMTKKERDPIIVGSLPTTVGYIESTSGEPAVELTARDVTPLDTRTYLVWLSRAHGIKASELELIGLQAHQDSDSSSRILNPELLILDEARRQGIGHPVIKITDYRLFDQHMDHNTQYVYASTRITATGIVWPADRIKAYYEKLAADGKVTFTDNTKWPQLRL